MQLTPRTIIKGVICICCSIRLLSTPLSAQDAPSTASATPPPPTTAEADKKIEQKPLNQNPNAKKKKKKKKKKPGNRKRQPGRIVPPQTAGAHTQKVSAAEKAYLEPGRWKKLSDVLPKTEMTPEQQEIAEQLESIGYLDGSKSATATQVITLHNEEEAWQGLNLYTAGHAPEAYLMDMNAQILHRWAFPFEESFPDYKGNPNARGQLNWRKAHLYPNGDLLAIHEGIGILKLDKDSNLIWSNMNKAHHDVDVAENGNIYVLTRIAHIVPEVNPNSPLLEDFVTILDPDGNEIKSISLLKAFVNSTFSHLWPDHFNRRGDVFHTNTLFLINEDHTEFSPHYVEGRIIFSILRFNVVAILDPETELVTWGFRSDFRSQHDPKIIDNGNLLIFDNKGGRNASRVLEYDINTRERVWQYRGNATHPFYSATCGSAQRLPNGNTLVCESDGGRAFEVNAEDELIWEFFNPHRAGDNQEYIATLFDLLRLPKDFPHDWAVAPQDTEATPTIIEENPEDDATAIVAEEPPESETPNSAE